VAVSISDLEEVWVRDIIVGIVVVDVSWFTLVTLFFVNNVMLEVKDSSVV
jgi:hypothetical protein